MVSVSDIMKLLDQIPIWKRLNALPARVEALEARLAKLEATPADPETACPRCGATMNWVSEAPHPTFGVLGTVNETRRCQACGIERIIRREAGGR